MTDVEKTNLNTGKIEEIHDGNAVLLALVIRERAAYGSGYGVRFFTSPEQSLQVGSMRRPKGHMVLAHTHPVVTREVVGVSEVLLVKSGFVRLSLHGTDGWEVPSRILGPGDVVVLIAGGHGLEMLEEAEIFEVRTGPYLGKDVEKVYLPMKKESDE